MFTRFTERPVVQEFVGHEAITAPSQTKVIGFERQLDSERLDGVQRLTFGVAEPDNEPHSVVIAPVAWSDYSDRPFQKRRLGTMAKFSGARVIGLDMPGMGKVDGVAIDQLSEKQVEQLRNGHMTDLSEGYWAAMAQRELLFDANDKQLPVVLWGNSLSTLTVAEMAVAAPDTVKIQDLMLSESLGLDEVNPYKLGLRFLMKGGKDLSKYKAMNDGMPEYQESGLGGLVKQFAAQPQAHWLSMIALSRGKQYGSIIDAVKDRRLDCDQEHGTRIHNITAEHGLASDRSISRLSDKLNSLGFGYNTLQNRQVLTGEYHGYQDSLPALLAAMSRLAVIEAAQH